MTVDELDRVVPITTRQWQRRFRHWRRWAIMAAAVVVIAVLVWVVYFSSLLGFRSVSVTGEHAVSFRQISAAAAIAPGTPLVRVNLKSVQARVEAIPAIASASVSRSWPHTVSIAVTERKPIAVVHQNGAWWVMDKDAVLFAKADAHNSGEPIVELDGRPAPGTLHAVASVLGVLPPSLLDDTRRVTASSIDSITLILKNGSQVRWGGPAESATKAEVLTALLHQKAHLYDVTIPSQPAIKK